MKKAINNIWMLLIIFVSILILFSTKWALNTFDNISIDEIIFHLLVPLKGTDTSYFEAYFLEAFIPIVIVTIIMFIIFHKQYNKHINLSLSIKKLNKNISFNFLNHKWIYLLLLFIISIYYCSSNMNLHEFLVNQFSQSSFIEDNYVDPNDVELTFPKKKRNLIYIYLESMETSYSSYEEGGEEYESLIPNLTNIAKDNISFSNTDKLGGFYSTPGASWTIGGMVAQTSGIPLKISIEDNSYSGYKSFLPGVTTLGEILESEGYNQLLMVGSDSTFGGRKDYFMQHGNYEIYDLNTAINKGKMTEEDKVFWGIEDANLFQYAKEELINLSQKNEPFNFTMLTVNTHPQDGWVNKKCKAHFDSNYANSVYCSDKEINEFIKWVKNQDFYKNTTVIMVGDHLTMSNRYISKDYIERTVYNVFINSAVESSNYLNRTFLAYDIFPTTLASLGVDIEGNRLGLGTNLFSDKESLAEEYGYIYNCQELNKKSVYYDKNFVFKK